MVALVLHQLAAGQRLSQRTLQVRPLHTTAAELFHQLLVAGPVMRLVGHIGHQQFVAEGSSSPHADARAGFWAFRIGGLPARARRLAWRMGLFGQTLL